jgi:two-component system NtrC family sensor kinase
MQPDAQRGRTKVKNMLLISMILVPMVPVILILGIGYYYFTISVEKGVSESMKRIITDHGRMIGQFLDERKADLDMVLNTYSFDELADEKHLERIFTILKNRSPAFVDLGLFDENGLHLAYRGPYTLAGLVYKKTKWFQEVMALGTYVSDVFLGFRNEPHFIIAIMRKEEERRWILRATIDTHFFNNLVKDVRINQSGEAYIINEKGLLQTERHSGGHLMEISPDYKQIRPYKQPDHCFIARDETGLKHIYMTAGLKEGDWRLVVRCKVDEAFCERRRASYLILLILVIGGAGILFTAFSLTNRIWTRLETVEENRQRLAEQLVRATRLAELGQMAAGVAHEINNPLQIIKSEQALIDLNLSDLKTSGSLPDSKSVNEIEDSFSQIKKQVDRCAKITRSVLEFGRQSSPHIEQITLQSFIPEMVKMIARQAEIHGIRVEQVLHENLPPVNADASQLQQVLLNLFNNSMDAVIERHGVKGGLLRVEASENGTGMVTVSVVDNGCGISPENLDKVFTPFFSTKPVGKGTGLGLSVCYGIIENLGGSMEVHSRRDEGTTFVVRLPAAQKSEKNAPI